MPLRDDDWFCFGRWPHMEWIRIHQNYSVRHSNCFLSVSPMEHQRENINLSQFLLCLLNLIQRTPKVAQMFPEKCFTRLHGQQTRRHENTNDLIILLPSGAKLQKSQMIVSIQWKMINSQTSILLSLRTNRHERPIVDKTGNIEFISKCN